MSDWLPLSSIKHGRVVKPFLPMDKPGLAKLAKHFQNVYPGDDVYIFEEKERQWGRGYVVSQANPSDFSSAVINLNRLPDRRVRVAIVPLSHVRFIRDFELSAEAVDRGVAGRTPVPSMLDTEISTSAAVNGYDALLQPGMLKRPDLPATDAVDDLVAELKAATAFMTSHIYAMYSIGEFQLFGKLLALYEELESLRLTLSKRLFTTEEDVQMRRHASSLLTRIPKYLSATEKLTKFDEHEKDKLAHVDLSGYHAVMARDPSTGELFDYAAPASAVTPSTVAMNQILYALSASYPLNEMQASLDPQATGVLDRPPPSNIMVNFEAVSGSTKNTPRGYKGMTAYLYLRNKRRRLTESFAIQVGSHQELLLENVSAALFKNIPSNEVDNNGKVYLVAVIAEEVDIAYAGRALHEIRKGVAAGVTDISRIFSRHKGALAAGESHQFTIKMYGSFITPFDNVNASAATRNNGWGELVERIIQGSSTGVAINPRAESLVVSVKEIRNKSVADEVGRSSTAGTDTTAGTTPLVPIRTTLYDPLSTSNERVYVRMGHVHLVDTTTSARNAYLSVDIRMGNPDHTIVKGSNQVRTPRWSCVSVVPDETIGEVLSVAGIAAAAAGPAGPAGQQARGPGAPDDVMHFSVFANGDARAQGQFVLVRNGSVVDTDAKDTAVALTAPDGSAFGTLYISTEYVGTAYNQDPAVATLAGWRSGDSVLASRRDVLEALTQVQRKAVQQLLRFFAELLTASLEIFEAAVEQKQPEIELLAFGCIVHVLDVVVGKNDQYIYVFDDFCAANGRRFSVGARLLAQASRVLDGADAEWTQASRQFCRVSPFVLRLAVHCNRDIESAEANASITAFNTAVLKFVASSDARFVPEQVVVLESLNYYLESVCAIRSATDVWGFASSVLQHLGTRGLGAKEEADFILAKGAKDATPAARAKSDASSAVLAKKKKDEHRLITSKLALNRKILGSSLFQTDQRNAILFKTIDWSLEVLLSSYDIDASRLACGNLVKCFDIVWHDVVLARDDANWHLVRAVTRLLPIFARIFVKYNKYCKVQGLFKSKRTFTNFYQAEYPFAELTMDSIVTRETFVELLVELSTVLCYTTRFSKHCVGADGSAGFDSIAVTERDEEYLKQKYYTRKLSDANIVSLIQLSKIMYDAAFFPSDKWLSLYAVLVESSFTTLELLKRNMIDQFIPPSSLSEKFNTAIWGNYLRTILKMSTSKPAATCQLSRIPRQGCVKIMGDLRERGANLMEEVWDALGWEAVDEDVLRFQLKRFTGYQSEFLSSDYSILRDLILFALQRHSRCQVVGVHILWTIIASECILNEEGLSELAKEAITGFYDLFHSDGYKPLLQEIKSFIKLMKLTIKIDPEDVAYAQISRFIDNLTDFLYMLNDLRNVPFSDEFDDDRTFHKLNILGFLMNVDQPDLLYQFIDDMYQGNIAKGNYVQAALSLDLLASTYDWSLHTLLPPSSRPQFPQQTPFKRKESLYRMIGHNYAKGNALEQAVEIYTELREAYDKVALDLKGLAYANDKLSKLYNDLQNVDRIMPSYFRVSYIGSGFPPSLRGKHFIHQGLPFEQLSSMQDRLSRLHPGSRILSKESEFAKFQESQPIGKYLYINSVEPGRGFDAKNSLVSYSARLYLQNKDLRHFVSLKRLPNATGIHDLWCDEVIYESYESFPALMNRSEIKATTLNKLPPIESAYRAIITKNHDLANLESLIENSIKEAEDVSHYFGDLSRQVSGTVDSPVNGGVGQYRIFFTEKYDTPENKEYVYKLRAAFNDLAIILNRCLDWHGRLLSNSKLKESHAELLKLYRTNFKPEIEELKLIIRDTSDEDAGSVINGYTASSYSSDDSNSQLSRVRSNNSYSSSGSSEAKLALVNTGSSLSVHSGSEQSTGSRSTSGSRLMNWRQRRFN